MKIEQFEKAGIISIDRFDKGGTIPGQPNIDARISIFYKNSQYLIAQATMMGVF